MGESYSGVGPLVGEKGHTSGRTLALDRMNSACSLITGHFPPDAGKSADFGDRAGVNCLDCFYFLMKLKSGHVGHLKREKLRDCCRIARENCRLGNCSRILGPPGSPHTIQ